MFRNCFLFFTLTLALNVSFSQNSKKTNVAEMSQESLIYSVQSVFASNSSRIEIKNLNDQYYLYVRPDTAKFKKIIITKNEFLDLKDMLTKIQKNNSHKKTFCNRFWVEINYSETKTSKVFCSRSKTNPTKLTKQFLNEVDYLYKKY